MATYVTLVVMATYVSEELRVEKSHRELLLETCFAGVPADLGTIAPGDLRHLANGVVELGGKYVGVATKCSFDDGIVNDDVLLLEAEQIRTRSRGYAHILGT